MLLLGAALGLLIGPSAWGVTAATVVIPPAAGALETSAAAMAWPITVYIAAMAMASAIGGRVIGAHGAIPVLRAGAVLLGLGTVGAVLAPNLFSFTVSRLVLGAGAGCLASVSFGVAGEFETARRPRVLAVVAAVMAGSVGTGPLLGGILEALSWRWSMASPVLALVAVPLVWRAGARAAGGAGGPVDGVGATLLTVTVSAAIVLVQAPTTHVAEPWMWLTGVLTLAGSAGLAVRVRSVPDGFLPRSVVARRALLPWWAAGFGAQAGQVAGLVILPVLLLERTSWSTAAVGLALAAGALAGVGASALGARWAADRRGPYLAASNTVALAAALLATAVWRPAPWLLLVAAALAFSSFSAMQVLVLHRICEQVPAEMVPAATGIVSLCFLLGGAVGSAVAGTSASVLGFDQAGWVAALLPLVAGFAAVARPAPRPRRADLIQQP